MLKDCSNIQEKFNPYEGVILKDEDGIVKNKGADYS